MSQTPVDPGVSAAAAEHANTTATPEGAAPTPARSRRRHSGPRRATTPAEPAAPAAEPTAPVAASSTPPTESSAATSAPAATTVESAPSPRRARPSNRRPSRARGPQLVTPTRPDTASSASDQPQTAAQPEPLVSSDRVETSESAIPADTFAGDEVAGGSQPSEMAGLTPFGPESSVVTVAASPSAPGARVEATPRPTPSGHAAEPAFEAHIETVSAAEVAQAVEQQDEASAPTPVRRYRFDRPARTAAGLPAIRPERLASTAPVAPAPEVIEPAVSQEASPQAESLAEPETASTPEPQGAAAPAEPDAESEETLVPLVTEEPESEEAEAGATSGGAEGEAGQAPRRRRRRRRNGTSVVRHLETVAPASGELGEPTPISAISAHVGARGPESPASLEEPFPADLFASTGEEPEADYFAGGTPPYQGYPPYQQDAWTMGNAQQQIGQPRSPFGAPEPSAPRGFGAQPQGVATPFQERPTRPMRNERATDVPPMSANQLGSVITHAIQQQTDRLLTELRHTQAPPSMTVMFPPFPSTERVGVFVDVANLLYSARNLRVAIDFGRLLEFLRGNRRLVRAQAYAPTSPEPHAEQQFLSVVKGVGYRITTKNYKTFSSGAKKADLDLDLCMDIVRLVDAKAIDTVVLVSGDSDFLPLLEYCSDHGVRVEVAAFEDSASMILRQSCDIFVNLSLVEDIRD